MDFLDIDNDVEQQEEEDRLSGFQPLESGIYKVTVKAAYFDKSSGGAHNITSIFETEDKKTVKHIEYITNKKGNNFYIDKNTKKKRLLPGMQKMNGLANLIKGTDLKQQVVEDKVHKIWDSTQNKEIPQSRKTLIEWTGQEIYIGIQKIIENKQVKQGDIYVATADTREVNEIVKFFDLNKTTLAELNAGTSPSFYVEWEKVNTGVTRDKTDKSLKAGAPKTASGGTSEPLDFD